MRTGVVVLGLVAACGDGLAPADAVVAPDVPGSRVTVRVAGAGAPSFQVLFQNADSSLVLATRTGADGTANAYMAPGGFVTVIDRGLSGTELYTWADVQPGDELSFGGSGIPPLEDREASFAVSVPLDPGQEDYRVYTACGWALIATPGTTSHVALNGCAARQDLLAVSQDFETYAEHYVYADDAQLSGIVELPGPWRPFDTARIEVTGMPVQTRALNVGITLLDGERAIEVAERIGGAVLDHGAGATEIPMALPPGARARVRITPTFEPELPSTVRAIHWGPVQATTRLDIGARPLRGYHEFPTYLRGEHAIRWSEDGAGDPADAVMTGFQWYSRDVGQRSWVIVAPGNAETTVRFPRLPLADLMPASDATVFQPSTLTTFRVDAGGYARVKRTLPITWGSGFPWPIDTDEGTVLVQELGSPQFPF